MGWRILSTVARLVPHPSKIRRFLRERRREWSGAELSAQAGSGESGIPDGEGASGADFAPTRRCGLDKTRRRSIIGIKKGAVTRRSALRV